MRTYNKIGVVLIMLFLYQLRPVLAQRKTADVSPVMVTFKKVDTVNLKLQIYNPVNVEKDKSYPAIVFFFGGGWRTGSPDQFRPHALYFASRGIVSILADYRVKDRHGSTPVESLRDAKSAIRYIRTHAVELHIDTSKLVAAGGSAGGQLAAAAALINDVNTDSDDLSVSAKPNALVLFNPAVDNGPGGAGFEQFGAQYKIISPLHNIQRGLPPTIFFIGTKDDVVPVETARYYKKAYERAGNRLELHEYEGQTHGFFNSNRSMEFYQKTVLQADLFLSTLGYLQGTPTISVDIPAKQNRHE